MTIQPINTGVNNNDLYIDVDISPVSASNIISIADTNMIDMSQYTTSISDFNYLENHVIVQEPYSNNLSNYFNTTNNTSTFKDFNITGTNINDIIFEEVKEFENCMPSIIILKEMCEMYPGFKKAFDNFKTMYNLVKEEYELQKKAVK